MTLFELRTECIKSTQTREVLYALYDTLTDTQHKLKTLDLKAMDLSLIKDAVQSMLECVADNVDDLNEADHKLHTQEAATMRGG